MSSEADNIARLRWRCRRGMLELDVVLACFLHHHLAHLSPPQLDEFARLLDLPDQDLWQLVREPQQRVTPVMRWLQTCGEGADISHASTRIV
ncbi:MAG: succinate dehydrogenase assembly factor 2 [Sulfuriferula sp.]|nr:succinate dehydrogenase assembly factor 2 [Sulfuriferula sp.]